MRLQVTEEEGEKLTGNTLKLLTLNAWAGKVEALGQFIQTIAAGADVLCFQEVTSSSISVRVPGGEVNEVLGIGPMMSDLFQQLCRWLPDHRGLFFPLIEGYSMEGKVDIPLESGNAIFIRRTLPFLGSGELFVYGKYGDFNPENIMTHPRSVCWVTTELSGEACSIFNLHGLWDSSGKGDTPTRIIQSESVFDVMRYSSTRRSSQILCGDFNLDQGTRSLEVLATGRRDLVKEYGITSTRTPLYRKYNAAGKSQHADNILIPLGMVHEEFSVLPHPVSDHAALSVTLGSRGNRT
jgi:endonuclease/exonuclease/phosphatase family metal-dependent hydrolase